MQSLYFYGFHFPIPQGFDDNPFVFCSFHFPIHTPTSGFKWQPICVCGFHFPIHSPTSGLNDSPFVVTVFIYEYIRLPQGLNDSPLVFAVFIYEYICLPQGLKDSSSVFTVFIFQYNVIFYVPTSGLWQSIVAKFSFFQCMIRWAYLRVLKISHLCWNIDSVICRIKGDSVTINIRAFFGVVFYLFIIWIRFCDLPKSSIPSSIYRVSVYEILGDESYLQIKLPNISHFIMHWVLCSKEHRGDMIAYKAPSFMQRILHKPLELSYLSINVFYGP